LSIEQKIIDKDNDSDWETEPDYVSTPIEKESKVSLSQTQTQLQPQTQSQTQSQSQSQTPSNEQPTQEDTVIFGVRRGKCQTCSCQRYQRAMIDGVCSSCGISNTICLNCGHYPAAHEDLGSAQDPLLDRYNNHWILQYEDLTFDFPLGTGSYGEVCFPSI
jgi:hypothetical protein